MGVPLCITCYFLLDAFSTFIFIILIYNILLCFCIWVDSVFGTLFPLAQMSVFFFNLGKFSANMFFINILCSFSSLDPYNDISVRVRCCPRSLFFKLSSFIKMLFLFSLSDFHTPLNYCFPGLLSEILCKF